MSILFVRNDNETQLCQSFSKKGLICAELSLPARHILLERSSLIKQIEEKFKKQKGIKTLALIGIGGAGKTTLARQYAYAYQQQADIIWEINAETKNSLTHSFETLAYALAEIEKEKETLNSLQDIKNSEERLKKLIHFVRAKLKYTSNWLLIYDNVEKFSEIQKYFPTDTKTWGTGKVIVTTRDSNNVSNNHIHETLLIAELTETEKFNLFKKIINNASSDTPSKVQTQRFLSQVPSFPLDVSVAAYHIKATNISYETYLENLIFSKKL